MSHRPETDVLLCGAGPTGLVLAMRLAKSGSACGSSTRRPSLGRPRARWSCTRARSSSTGRWDLAAVVVAEGMPFHTANLWVRRRRVVRVELGPIGKGLRRLRHRERVHVHAEHREHGQLGG
jgi:2-polyprenyl-6-methoxyphenol hydroxylase-like FAD-dependent oxidoreductase